MKEGFDSPTGYDLVDSLQLTVYSSVARQELSTEKDTSRDGAVVARRAHNPKVTGSSPVPATKPKKPT